MSGRLITQADRDRRLFSSALIASGGHTFAVRRVVLPTDVDAVVFYDVQVPDEEGELRLVRCGYRNEGPFGLEFVLHGPTALPTGRALWWVHALHAATRLAEELNVRARH